MMSRACSTVSFDVPTVRFCVVVEYLGRYLPSLFFFFFFFFSLSEKVFGAGISVSWSMSMASLPCHALSSQLRTFLVA